jgi:hypothetical protein
MKNYILFSTNDSRAIDSVSFVIETSMDRNEATKMIAKACKYNNFTVSPVGAPLSCTVFDMEHALEVIKSIKLHKRHRVIDQKKIDIVTSVTGMPGVTISTDCGKVILQMNTDYENGNPALVCKENAILGQIIELFGSRHVAYHRTRNVFELVPTDDEELGVDFAVCKDDVVQITKKYSYIEVEI